MARTTEERLAILEAEGQHTNMLLRDIQQDVKDLPKNLKRELKEDLTEASRFRVVTHTNECRADRERERKELKEFLVKLLHEHSSNSSDGKKPSRFEKFVIGILSVGAAIGTAVYAYINGGRV